MTTPIHTSAEGRSPSHAATEIVTRAARFPVAVRYTMEGDLRFLSHHDELRLLGRAVIRARWPVAFTYGFNPTPRIAIPLPRPVGLACTDQLARIDLLTSEPVESLRERLSAVMPVTCRVLELIGPCSRETPHPVSATFAVALLATDLDRVHTRIPELLAASTLPLTRAALRQAAAKQLDIRPYLDDLSVGTEFAPENEPGATVLRMHLRFEQSRTVKPTDVLRLLELAADHYDHRITRTAIQWDICMTAPNGAVEEVENERMTVGHEEEANKRFKNNAPAAFLGSIED